MRAPISDELRAGAENLLCRAAGLRQGRRVLILHEPAGLGFYDTGIIAAVWRVATDLGLDATLREVPFGEEVQDPPPGLADAMRGADFSVFLARLGDQIRYRTSLKGISTVVCYALDAPMLASRFGRADHRGFVALKEVIDDALAAAGTIRITCPEGTDISGHLDEAGDQTRAMNITRFPQSVHSAVSARGFEGRVVQRGFLVGTGSHYYAPYAQPLTAPLTVHIRGHRIAGFEGARADIDTAERHYQEIAARFGIDPWHVHSWHAGMHPGCAFPQPASASFERWSGGAFGNPRLMHFHTCGDYAPGEISLNLLDPTITLDGVAVWDDGRLYPERLKGGMDILSEYSELRALFDAPSQECGLGASGALSFD